MFEGDQSESFKRGLETRRDVVGRKYVDSALNNATEYNWPMQELVTEYCWDAVWNRPGLSRRDRSLLNLGMIAALGHMSELKAHVRGALTNGLTKEEIREVFLQTVIYCGVPSGLNAFKAAQEAIAEVEAEGQ